jgi:hypothetical protein
MDMLITRTDVLSAKVEFTDGDEMRDFFTMVDNHMMKKSQDDDLKGLVRKFFSYLDIVETNDDGKEFRPNQISSCRAMDIHNMGILIGKIKEIVDKD